ncbi:hypothetical protein ASE14_12115 [Agromyces sp. Root81]|uniref:UvrD-helicase domain-containing protein n=1 Tax=Agromyces sp. Root81 TaxID=1736601 RepID=UPI0006F8F181|nr:UvrD-helicase domain-containing protein [Agromyces sp. Root81]KRC61581.1 hypothetical protein ASE14_12115 [Agromyces sp. Root81]
MTFTPTAEQQAALDAYRTGGNLVIEAGAGTGKTSTLQLIARDNPRRRGLYVAFNKAIATEAQRKFAGTGITAKTVHSLAFNAVGRPFGPRLGAKYMFWHDKAKVLGVRERFDLGPSASQRFLAPKTLVRLTTETVDAFARSAADELTEDMMVLPENLTLADDAETHLRKYVTRLARAYWQNVTFVDGTLPFKHDYYLKLWQLSRPSIDADLIMFDEAQDADPIMTAVISAQQNTQLAVVGDPNQAIYSWRGAIDAMNAFGGIRTQLTQSFRFGQAIADEANFWLELLDSDLRLSGMPGAASSVWKSGRQPEAILTRSNVGAIREVLESQRRGTRVGIAGANKAREMHALAKAALDLQQRGSTSHPDLDIFNSWDDVVTFSQMDDGTEIAALVNVVEEYTAERVIDAIDACVPTEQAEQTISTAHVAKGLEWFHVRIANDFREPGKDEDGNQKPIIREEARLSYVAVTRAQRHLDASGLDWAKQFTAGVAA